MGATVLPAHPPGPVTDKLSIWPSWPGNYGLDATFSVGADSNGPLSAAEIAVALESYVH